MDVYGIFALEINYFPVLLSVRALLAKLPKRNKHKVVSGGRPVTLPVKFACKPGLSLTLLLLGYPGSRVTLPPCKQGLSPTAALLIIF